MSYRLTHARFGAALLTLLTVCACAVNPVTGERNFQVLDGVWERQVGAQMTSGTDASRATSI